MNDLWLWVLLAGLANYKAAHMVSQDGDDGPFDLFKSLRDKIGTSNWFGKGFHCFSCVSFWGGLVATSMIGVGIPWNLFIIVWGAVSTIAYAVWRYFG